MVMAAGLYSINLYRSNLKGSADDTNKNAFIIGRTCITPLRVTPSHQRPRDKYAIGYYAEKWKGKS